LGERQQPTTHYHSGGEVRSCTGNSNITTGVGLSTTTTGESKELYYMEKGVMRVQGTVLWRGDTFTAAFSLCRIGGVNGKTDGDDGEIGKGLSQPVGGRRVGRFPKSSPW